MFVTREPSYPFIMTLKYLRGRISEGNRKSC